MEARQPVPDDEIDLRQLFGALWRGRWTILALMVAAALIAAVLSVFVIAPTYESRTYIQLSEHSSPAYATPQAAARVLTSVSFLRPIAARYGIPTDRRLERMVRAEAVRDTRIVYLRIRDRNPQRLEAFTRDVVQEFLRVASERVRQRREVTSQRLAAVQAQLDDVDRTLRLSREVLTRLQSRADLGTDGGFARSFALNAAAVSEGVYGSLLAAQRDLQAELIALEPPYLVQEPYVPSEPVSPRPVLNTAVAATLGLLVGAFGVLVREAWAAVPQQQRSPSTVIPEPH